MWFLYSLVGIFSSGIFLNKIREIYIKFYPSKYKTFEDLPELEKYDDYCILCYRIKTEDGKEIEETEITNEDLEKIEENSKISYINIEYMFNGQFMKYLTYKKDITFPIYEFKVQPSKYKYYPESIFLNEVNITNYLTPYLGPLCNFYIDREEPIKLKDALRDHPDFEKFDFEDGNLILVSNDIPIYGKKCIVKKLPCNLVWKRHAAIDPKDDCKLE